VVQVWPALGFALTLPLQQLGLNEEPVDDEEMEDAAPAEVEALDEEMSETSADSVEGASDSDDDDDEANAEADPELRAAVEAALKAAGIADESDASSGEESEEEEEELLDDEQMMQIDDQLAEIFRQRAGAKKEDAGEFIRMHSHASGC
jgi:DNA polymerase phi